MSDKLKQRLQRAVAFLRGDKSHLSGTVPVKKPLTANHVALRNPYESKTFDRVIWNAVQDHLRDMEPDETLVIVLGEAHAAPSHIMAQAGLLTNLAHWRGKAPNDPDRQFLFACELPYDLLSHDAARFYNIPLQHKLHEHDPKGHLALQTRLIHFEEQNQLSFAPQSKRRVFNTVLRHDITACFNDAAYNNEFQYLQRNDPVAGKIAKDEYGIDLSSQFIRASGNATGMGIRNGTMKTRALEKAKEKNVRIIVQQTGMSHLYGHLEDGYPYEQSLVAYYNRQSGCRTLGVFFNTQRDGHTAEKIVDPRAFEENPHHIIFANAADEQYMSFYPAGEHRCLKQLDKSHGPEDCPYAIDEPGPGKKKTEPLLKAVLNKRTP